MFVTCRLWKIELARLTSNADEGPFEYEAEGDVPEFSSLLGLKHSTPSIVGCFLDFTHMAQEL